MTKSKTKVRKAIIAAAGFGTRFLPQTKAMPKEMLPIVDKPIIQYVVEEMVDAGIEDIIIVTGYSKRAIEDHFDTPNAELSAILHADGKEHMLDGLHKISDMANFVFVRQKHIRGNAAPLLYARHLINDEPFVYTWADEFITAQPSRLKQILAVHERTGGSIFTCMRVKEDEDYKRYGIVAGEPVEEGLLKMQTVIEKPSKDNAPSDLFSACGYVLAPEILGYVEEAASQHKGNGELKVQPSMQQMIDDGHPFYALEVTNSRYYDAGSKSGYLETIVDHALLDPELGPGFREYLRKRLDAGK